MGAVPDDHLPHRRDHTGDEPSDARSSLTLRLALAVFGVLVCATGALTLVVVADGDESAWLFVLALAALAVVGAVDAAVVLRRLRRHDLG